MYTFHMKSSRTRGFTLIELLVVIAIIGILSSVVLSSLNTARSKSYDAGRVTKMREVQKALELYASDNDGKYPIRSGSNWNGTCSAWTVLPQNGAIPGLVTAGYMSELPLDPEVNTTTNTCCYLYHSSSNGSEYKYLLYNCPTSKACYGSNRSTGLIDPVRSNACAVYSPGYSSF